MHLLLSNLLPDFSHLINLIPLSHCNSYCSVSCECFSGSTSVSRVKAASSNCGPGPLWTSVDLPYLLAQRVSLGVRQVTAYRLGMFQVLEHAIEG